MVFTILEERKVVYVYSSLKQLKAAAAWVKTLDADVKHYKTPDTMTTLRAMLPDYEILKARPADRIDRARGIAFSLPVPGAEYMRRNFMAG